MVECPWHEDVRPAPGLLKDGKPDGEQAATGRQGNPGDDARPVVRVRGVFRRDVARQPAGNVRPVRQRAL